MTQFPLDDLIGVYQTETGGTWGSYFSHLIIGSNGIVTIAGNPVDADYLQATSTLAFGNTTITVGHKTTIAQGTITFTEDQTGTTFSGVIKPRPQDGNVSYAGRRMIAPADIEKFVGIYNTETGGTWGTFFSPLIIGPGAQFSLAGSPIFPTFDRSTNHLKFERAAIFGPTKDTIASADIPLDYNDGEAKFTSTIQPRPQDGPVPFTGQRAPISEDTKAFQKIDAALAWDYKTGIVFSGIWTFDIAFPDRVASKPPQKLAERFAGWPTGWTSVDAACDFNQQACCFKGTEVLVIDKQTGQVSTQPEPLSQWMPGIPADFGPVQAAVFQPAGTGNPEHMVLYGAASAYKIEFIQGHSPAVTATQPLGTGNPNFPENWANLDAILYFPYDPELVVFFMGAQFYESVGQLDFNTLPWTPIYQIIDENHGFVGLPIARTNPHTKRSMSSFAHDNIATMQAFKSNMGGFKDQHEADLSALLTYAKTPTHPMPASVSQAVRNIGESPLLRAILGAQSHSRQASQWKAWSIGITGGGGYGIGADVGLGIAFDISTNRYQAYFNVGGGLTTPGANVGIKVGLYEYDVFSIPGFYTSGEIEMGGFLNFTVGLAYNWWDGFALELGLVLGGPGASIDLVGYSFDIYHGNLTAAVPMSDSELPLAT